MISRHLLRVAFLLLSLPVAITSARAQSFFTFPDTPCDSTRCDSLFFTNEGSTPQVLYSIRMRDSISFSVAPPALPNTIPAGGRLALSVCFTPNRKGTISDSLRLYIRTATGFDTIRVRLSGKGIGPSVVIAPSSLLLFPKTTTGSRTTLTIRIINNGDLPYDFASALPPVPPPFSLVPPLPPPILPGDTVDVQVAFEPKSSGVYSSSINLPTACGTSIQIQLNGATELIGTGAVLRIGKAGFNPVNKEQTPCDISRCTDVILSNVGNAPLNIESIDWLHNNAGYTFTSGVTTPFMIAANATRTIPVCLNSRSRGFLRDTLVVKSNSRTSIAFGLTIDVSGSMEQVMHCGGATPRRIDEAQIQAKNFIAQTLLNLPGVGVQDQLVISSYSTFQNSYDPDITFIFPLAYITDANRLVAESEINKLATKNHTPTGLALLQMIDSLSASPLKNRVIVLLTDGDADDFLTIPVDSISRTAQAKGIRIFTIGLNLSATAISYLQGLAAGANGVAFPATDCNSLQTAFETITDLVSRGNVMREPFSIRITSPVLVATKSTDFDSVYIGGKTCRDITITNVGEGDAIVDTMMINDLLGGTATGEFYMQPSVKFPVLVPESGQLKFTLCFTPAKIRVRGGSATLTYNSCGVDTLHTTFGGVGFASANLRISDRRVGPPGSIITMPVYADSAIGAYGVNTITYGLRWDKSVLDLKAIRPGSAAAGTTVKMTAPVSYANFYATVGLVTQGTSLTGGGELAELDFEVLRGDSLVSDVELTNGLFEDDNPRTTLNNAGAVALDSTCFLSSKPIKFATVAKVAVGDVTPTPSTGHQATIPVSTDIATSITLEVYAADGSRAMAPALHQIPSGGTTLGVNVARLAAGSYYAMLRTESGEIMMRKFVVAR